MQGQHRRGGSLRLALASAAVAAWYGGASAQPAGTGVLLADGVVVDVAAGTAYVMSPNASVRAVSLGTGETLWASKEAARPLAVAGSVLVAQAEPSAERPGRLQVVTLDTSRRGEPKVKGFVDLPPGLRAPVGETLKTSFTLAADVRADEVLIAWKHVARRAQGIVPGADEAAREKGPLARPPDPTPVTRGALRMSLATGAVTPLTGPVAAAAPPLEPVLRTPSGDARVKDAAGTQFLSADDRHVLVSERVADDRVWDKYRLSVYERATGRRIGEVRSHVSAAPFVVRDALLVFATRTFARRQGGEQPPKLRAFDLGSGREAWSVELRDTEYRGPFPP